MQQSSFRIRTLCILALGCIGTFGGNLGNIQAQSLENIAPQAVSKLRSTVLYFGEPIRIHADILREANIPEKELTIVTKFMGDEAVEAPFHEPFTGMIIPGYARKLDVEIRRTTVQSTIATKHVLWHHTYDVQQIPPTFDASKASVENALSKGKAQKIGECALVIKGVRVDFAKPVDFEKNAIVRALVNDLEIADPALDMTKTTLQFVSGGQKEDKFQTALKPENISISGFFDAGVFLLNVTLKGLPKISLKGKTLQGTFAVKLSVTLQNRRAMRSATAYETILIPCSVTF
ncbi:MAG: hypothetical protein MUF71_20695 [Candidatus Kapabacteria bacterium]|jgi:hypothetical protein|nr:hypothetical protein [Candidatus Kapabacteria bacterium]